MIIVNYKMSNSDQLLDFNYKMLNYKYTSILNKLNEAFQKNDELILENSKLKEENIKLSELKFYLTPTIKNILLVDKGTFNVPHKVTTLNVIMIGGGGSGGYPYTGGGGSGYLFEGSYIVDELTINYSVGQGGQFSEMMLNDGQPTVFGRLQVNGGSCPKNNVDGGCGGANGGKSCSTVASSCVKRNIYDGNYFENLKSPHVKTGKCGRGKIFSDFKNILQSIDNKNIGGGGGSGIIISGEPIIYAKDEFYDDQEFGYINKSEYSGGGEGYGAGGGCGGSGAHGCIYLYW